MADLGTTAYEVDNLVVGSFITDRAYPVASGNTVTRGQVMKLTAGKLSPCLTQEAPHSIMLENVDASLSDVFGSYMLEGVVLESEVNYNTGSAEEFREALRQNNILTRR